MFDQLNLELEVPDGLEDIAVTEIKQLLKHVKPRHTQAGIITFDYDDSLKKLEQLRSVYACYIVLDFAVPRPKALLGHQYFTEIIKACQLVLKDNHFKTITLNAAGSASSVMRRILDEIADNLSLTPDQYDGDLLIRIRKQKENWQVMIRTTPRPLSTRRWRIFDYQGALNAPTAYAMNRLIHTQQLSKYANFMCGSGTLLIEREYNSHVAYGFDINSQALQLAKANMIEARVFQTQLIEADVTQIPLDSNSLYAITSDMPFGQLQGSHKENQALYPKTLLEMHRVLVKGGVTIIITHEVRLLENIIRSQNWHINQVRKVNLRGIHPRIYVLEKQ